MLYDIHTTSSLPVEDIIFRYRYCTWLISGVSHAKQQQQRHDCCVTCIYDEPHKNPVFTVQCGVKEIHVQKCTAVAWLHHWYRYFLWRYHFFDDLIIFWCLWETTTTSTPSFILPSCCYPGTSTSTMHNTQKTWGIACVLSTNILIRLFYIIYTVHVAVISSMIQPNY